MKKRFKFPKNFIWGAATASYQIEGATDEGGRGRSVWDTFCERPGKITNGDSGEGSCDHYNLWKEDISLMKKLGLQSYRFSIAWPRIFPDGDGNPNQAGINFYNNLIDGLIEAGITPAVTLFHWDLPQNLQNIYGGWKSSKLSRIFADYARFCARTFGDRVTKWFTINEIICFTAVAHDDDRHAPGGYEDISVSNQTMHNALLAHGLAMQAIREECPDAEIGLVENLQTPWPVIDTEENHIAVHKAFYDMNQSILFPVMTGKYDKEAYIRERKVLPGFTEEEMKIISSPMDMIGYNIYTGPAVRAADNERGWERLEDPDNFPRTDMGWTITPQCIYWAVMNTKNHFGNIPVYITENGMAANDKTRTNGEVWDIDRLEYFRSHLEMCARAIMDGGNLKGYYAWSLMDNFEWAHGYSKRFGLIKVNYRTKERKIKLSGEFFADVIKNNGV
ncbi:MAG: beta-glucosidase [Spirochaetes bacterium]|nr:beta-glucosidase [Spirochaetota bacterium]